MAESEVARIRVQIDAEERASQLALTGPAYTSPHRFITARMEHLAGVVQGLIDEYGAEGAQTLIVQAMEREAASWQQPPTP